MGGGDGIADAGEMFGDREARGDSRYRATSECTKGNCVATLARLLAVSDLFDLLVVRVEPDSCEIAQMVDR